MGGEDAVGRANARLRELGYEPADATVTANGSPAHLRLAGKVIYETTGDADDMLAVLRMLPSKAHLLAFRHVLGLTR